MYASENMANTDVTEILSRYTDLSDKRIESVRMAAELGADEATLVLLCDSLRVSRGNMIIIPAQRYENLSRGKGWCRKGRGDSAVWGERADGGYRVGPGKWTVGGSDGFSRKGQDEWTVKYVTVGDQTWTVAS